MWSKMLKCLQLHKREHRDVILETCFLDPETEEQHFATANHILGVGRAGHGVNSILNKHLQFIRN